jgi:hypothetical protein
MALKSVAILAILRRLGYQAMVWGTLWGDGWTLVLFSLLDLLAAFSFGVR